MRPTFSIAVGLIVAAGAVTSCTDREVAAPKMPAPNFGGETPPPCDPKKGDCEILGRMTGGGGSIIIGDILVTKGLTLHCDIVLSNNLEVNWPGNKWHLDKPITSAECIDDPAFSPEPPSAPFDTFIGEAVGRLNGVDGSFIRFTFVDAGEPGGKNDQAGIQIWAPGADPTVDAPVLNLPLGPTDRGNLQAHFDQPHR
jgi:hypothetical protein